MGSNREPLKTLSPSQLTSPRSTSILSTQTTPKLSRRERLATMNSLLTRGHFAALFPDEYFPGGIKRDMLRKRCELEVLSSPVRIQVSPCSPEKQAGTAERIDSVHLSRKDYLDPTQLSNLPFSPKLSASDSPMTCSPNYKHPTPTKSPLYTPNRRNLFLGRGSFGNVTLCQHKDKKFALKVIHHSAVNSVGEFNFLHVRHPHLVRILNIVKVMDRYFICMEFAGHCNLQQILDTKSELDFQRKLSFCRQIVLGLRHCHRQHIVHGDVKPANVMVSPYGICKLGDFGHSIKVNQSSEISFDQEDMIGTAAYAAPEVLRGLKPTSASDVYSYGLLLWQAYTRECPYSGEHPHVTIYKVANYGSRPTFEEPENDMMKFYQRLTKFCWDAMPHNRPTADGILLFLDHMMQMSKGL